HTTTRSLSRNGGKKWCIFPRPAEIHGLRLTSDARGHHRLRAQTKRHKTWREILYHLVRGRSTGSTWRPGALSDWRGVGRTWAHGSGACSNCRPEILLRLYLRPDRCHEKHL